MKGWSTTIAESPAISVHCSKPRAAVVTTGGILVSQEIGSVKSGRGDTWRVHWDPSNKKVYVQKSNWTNPESCGTANSAGDAMRKAEAHLYNK